MNFQQIVAFLDPVGNYLDDKPFWIKVINRFGQLRNVYFGREFKAMRAGLGINFPGNYV
jgi:hypothetical protein